MYLTLLEPPENVVELLWPKAIAAEHGNMDDLRNLLIPIITPFIVLSVISVALRIFARWRNKCLGFDDVLIVVSLAPTIAVDILLLQQRDYGLGLHIYDAINTGVLNSSNIQAARMRIYIMFLVFTIGHVLVRLSILISFYRIFSKLDETTTFRILRWYIAFFLLTAPVVIFADAFQCTPAQAFWNVSVADGNCGPQRGILIFGRALNCFNNFVIFILPLSRLWRLKLPIAQRVGLGIVFGLGFVVCALSVVKLALFVRLLYYNPLYDYTWSMHPILVICSIENILAITCSCAPVLRHYINMFSSSLKRISPIPSLRNPSPQQQVEDEENFPYAETSGWYEDAESETAKQQPFWSRNKSRANATTSTLGAKSILDSLPVTRESANLIWPIPPSPPAIMTAPPMVRDRGYSFSHASTYREPMIGRRGSIPRLGGSSRGNMYRDSAGRRGSAPAISRSPAWEVQYHVEISQSQSQSQHANPSNPINNNILSMNNTTAASINSNRLPLPSTSRHTHNPSRERRAISEAVEMMDLGIFGVLDDCDGGGAGVRCVNHQRR